VKNKLKHQAAAVSTILVLMGTTSFAVESLPSIIWDGPQTDWGQLDATHPPQCNPINHFPSNIAPDEFTLDAVE
jgi:hypothetical protein